MAATLYKQFQRLTPQEQSYLRSRPYHAFAIQAARDTAYKETQRRFGRNGHNDRSDAFRHCYWSALLARELGFQDALKFTTAHEAFPANPPAEKTMDIHNNRIGLDIGRVKGTDQALSMRCMAALQAGKLKIMVK
ncbi:DUF6973 domain-containing protein [Massilia sp. DD77]|uniref:DUF6973 domain-containing protein n=1 Tax=Massilia sp. DD77 TaxID=3109349 RepID=UPI002FFF87A7